jgi:hypothetical protein
MWPFKKSKPYEINIEGHRVYMSWDQPIHAWNQKAQDSYLPELQAAVRLTIDDAAYPIISSGNMQADPRAHDYVAKVRNDLIVEYGLVDSEETVWIGNYHMGMLVIGFKAEPAIKYPYYYKGIQLKPMVAQQGDELDAALRRLLP